MNRAIIDFGETKIKQGNLDDKKLVKQLIKVLLFSDIEIKG